VEFLVEEPSAQAALRNLLPGILGPHHTFNVHPHNGKQDLLRHLPDRLKGYRRWLPKDWSIVVLVDRDREQCLKLKARLEVAAKEAGLPTKTSAGPGKPFRVLNRVVIEELEAWFFGDVAALRAAYPKLSSKLANQARYRDPDTIVGGTWEALERELQRAGYYPQGLPKLETARNVSAHMDPPRNRSGSFQAFCDGLLDLVGRAP
jgi:hypothetical protein